MRLITRSFSIEEIIIFSIQQCKISSLNLNKLKKKLTFLRDEHSHSETDEEHDNEGEQADEEFVDECSWRGGRRRRADIPSACQGTAVQIL